MCPPTIRLLSLILTHNTCNDTLINLWQIQIKKYLKWINDWLNQMNLYYNSNQMIKQNIHIWQIWHHRENNFFLQRKHTITYICTTYLLIICDLEFHAAFNK